MKKHFLTTLCIVSVSAGSFLVSCSSDNSSEKAESSEHISKSSDYQELEPVYQAPDDFKANFKDVTLAYVELKNALVKSNNEQATEAAVEMVNKVEAVDMGLLEGEQLQFWEEARDQILQHGNRIVESEDLKTKREHFTTLSEVMIKTVKGYGGFGTTLYEQYCPMANNDTGGSWLSTEKEIRNPYYGDAMLKCGEVKAAIK